MAKNQPVAIWTNGCSDGNCPTVYVDDSAAATVIIQGFKLDGDTAAALGEVPAGEGVLRVPRELIVGAYEQLHGK